MPNWDGKKDTLEFSEVDLLFLIEMGIFSELKSKRIRFNPRPFSNAERLPSESIEVEKGFFNNLKRMKLRFNPRPFSNPEHLTRETVNVRKGILNDLKRMKLRFNPRPFTNPRSLSAEVALSQDENLVDLHLEIVKKIDNLIAEHEHESLITEFEPVTTAGEIPVQEVVEFREPAIKKPEIPEFKSEIGPENVFVEVDQEQEFYEIEPPIEVQANEENAQVDDAQTWMLDEEDKKSQKWLMGLGRIKVKPKDKPSERKTVKQSPKTVNNFKKTRMELEKTKQEIEERKKALEEAKQLEKEKEEELKNKKKEKLKEEKLKKLEIKKILREKKLEEKKALKVEQLKKLEIKKQEKEKIAKMKHQKKELEKVEQLKVLELQKQEKEAEKKRRHEELKRLEKEQLEEELRIEKLRLEELKEKEEELRRQRTEAIQKDKIETPPSMDKVVQEEKVTIDDKTLSDEDLEKLLPIIDKLLEKLPEDVINDFANSKDFSLYEKVLANIRISDIMGLLGKAQQKKKIEDSIKIVDSNRLDDEESYKLGLLERAKQKRTLVKPKRLGLLEKAKEKKQKIITGKPSISKKEKTDDQPEQRKSYDGLKTERKGKREVIEERIGFGWHDLGVRRIVLDYDTYEYVYEILEPRLNEDEQETKEELSRLFKMLADINISNMFKEEKEKYLGDTLEQIIIDNDIKFGEKKKKKTKKSDEDNLGFLKKGKKEEKEEDEDKKSKSFVNKLFPKKKKEEIKIEKEPKIKKPLTKKLFSKKEEAEKEPKKSKEELSALEKESKEKIFYHIYREFLGYGKIDIIMEDEGIEDISCDGHHVPIFLYHKKYDEIITNVIFDDELELNSFVVRLAQICGKQISIYSPIVDGKLPDGSRLQTTLARTVTKGSTFTIRKFKENPLTPVDLIDFQSISLDMAAYFWMAIEGGASILFCGGTASGKTTALNALSLFIPSQHKIISIEDTREVSLPHKNWIAGTTRQGFTSTEDAKTGKDIDMFDLIRAALRQRPKVVMVGEVRGREAYSLFQAMATGHTSYATVHASDIHTLIQRLENPPISLPRALLTSLDVIVFQNAIDIAGKTVRRMTSVTEVIKLDPDTNQLIFMEPFRWISKTDDRFESSGTSKILNNIRMQNDWTEERLLEEIENRMLILQWMLNNNIKDFKDVGRIVSDYSKYPDKLLQKVKGDLNK